MKRSPMPRRKKPLRRSGPIGRKRRKATVKAAPVRVPPLTATQKRRILKRDDYTCALCGLDCCAAAELARTTRDTVSRSYDWQTVSGDDQWQLVADAAGLSLDVVRSACRDGRAHVGEVDHIQPRSLQGGNEASNLRTLCVTCHRSKTAGDAARAAALPSTRKTV